MRKQAKKFLQHLEGGRDDDFDVGYGGGYGGSGGRGGRGTYGDLDFDGPMGGGGGRSVFLSKNSIACVWRVSKSTRIGKNNRPHIMLLVRSPPAM